MTQPIDLAEAYIVTIEGLNANCSGYGFEDIYSELPEGTYYGFSVDDKDYIALLPLENGKDNTSGEVWIYGYSENPDDPNEEPELRYIEDDDEYEKASEAFD